MGFHRAGLDRYTGFKTSPYTEGALFYGEKPVVENALEIIQAQTELVAEPAATPACEPGST
ncbi:MAG: hypothetical protein FJ134_10625 [Deltaproteobacteria bacterium]|nr:hypothetical protein [Deltaproteobacteria bacterium]